ncbi:MAG: SRPBCC domain-containing protein [Microthrixaceae bacterium]
MEYGSIQREIRVDASPEVVFEVITSPDHLKEWWPDEATLEPTPGFVGELVFGDRNDPGAHVPQITVVDAEPYRLFSFRWVYPEGETASPTNSLLVTFELTPSDPGTVVRMTETGFREKGWEVAVLEEEYRDHCNGWDHFLPRLVQYVAQLVSAE